MYISNCQFQKLHTIFFSIYFQILAILLNVDKNKVEVTIGRSPIQRDKPVVLELNPQKKTNELPLNTEAQGNRKVE